MSLRHNPDWALHSGPVTGPRLALPLSHVLVLATGKPRRGEGPVSGICSAELGAAPQAQAGLPGRGHGGLSVVPPRRQRGQTAGNATCLWVALAARSVDTIQVHI